MQKGMILILIAISWILAIISIVLVAILLILNKEIQKNKFARLLLFETKIFGILSVIYSLYCLSIFIIPGIYHFQYYMVRVAYILTAICWMVFGFGVLKRLSWARIGLIVISAIYIIDHIEYPSHIIAAIKNHENRALTTLVVHLIYFFSVIFFFTRSIVRRQFEKTQTNWFSRF
jgi:hypothetical protein